MIWNMIDLIRNLEKKKSIKIVCTADIVFQHFGTVRRLLRHKRGKAKLICCSFYFRVCCVGFAPLQKKEIYWSYVHICVLFSIASTTTTTTSATTTTTTSAVISISIIIYRYLCLTILCCVPFTINWKFHTVHTDIKVILPPFITSLVKISYFNHSLQTFCVVKT